MPLVKATKGLKKLLKTEKLINLFDFEKGMDKRGQMNFDNGVFSQEAPTEKNTNKFQRLLQGILMAIFLFIFAPILVSISDGMQPLVCGNPTVCLFFKFIVPAVILGGIFGILKYVWRND